MKHLKPYKVFESVDSVKKMVEDLLRDISDNDIPVEVELESSGPSWYGEEKILILIGNDIDWSSQTEKPSDLPLYENIHNLYEINDYLVGEGYHLESIALITNTEVDDRIKRMTSYEFEDFIKNIKDIQEGNEIVYKLNQERPPENWGSLPWGNDYKIVNSEGVGIGSYQDFPKIIRLVDIYYTNKSN